MNNIFFSNDNIPEIILIDKNRPETATTAKILEQIRMQTSQIVNQSWPFHINGNDNNDPWPKLCQENRVKPVINKLHVINLGESNSIANLDDSEYPELNSVATKNKHSCTAIKHCPQSTAVRISIPSQSNMEPKKSKTNRRSKRTDKICIDLQEILQNTRYISNKDLPRMKLNIYKGNFSETSNTIDGNKNSKVQKIKISISKDKRPSKLKRIILLNRKIGVQTNAEKRLAFEHQKMEAICKDVDAINFNALKITANPQINMDYTKHMYRVTLPCKNDKNKKGENTSEISIYRSSDIIEKMNNLCIHESCLANRVPVNNTPYFFKSDNAIENDIIQQTLSLEIKDDIKEEVKDNNELHTNFLTYSRNFREYCTNILTAELNDSLEKFLKEITRLQKRYHEKNPNKSKYKRRYYSGLKEVRKHVELKKVKFVIIAPDLEKVELEDGLDDQVYKLLDACKLQNVVFCFGLRRRKLGYFTCGKGHVGCVGVANYGGIEELFKNVLVELVYARNTFKRLSGTTNAIIDISKLISEDFLLSENISTLLKILSPICIKI